MSVLQCLKKVDLSNIQHITDLGIYELSLLPCLEELTMNGCTMVRSYGFGYICTMKMLRRLDIGHCLISEMSLLRIMNELPQLNWINVSYCSEISDEVVENYRVTKPHIDIVWQQ